MRVASLLVSLVVIGCSGDDQPAPDASRDAARSDQPKPNVDATADEAAFIGGRTELNCDSVYPVCKGKVAGCTLDESRYLTGTFPGTRKFLVATPAGDWVIRVLLFLDNQQSPGTQTEIIWYEPGCSDSYPYQISQDKAAGDLFQQAGAAHVFAKERPVTDAGDHLIEVYSDATCRYDLRVEVVQRP